MIQKGHAADARCAGVGNVINETVEKSGESAEKNIDESGVNVTERAIEKVKYFMEKENKKGWLFRLGVKEGGCSGYTYNMGLVEKKNKEDEIFEKNGVKIAIDKVSKDYMKGTTVDYVTGLMKTGFVVNNPNTKESCKCGHSFK